MSPSATTPTVRTLPVPAAWTGSDSVRPYPVSRLDQLVARQAAKTPHAIALRDGDVRVTYAELMQRAWRLSHALRARAIGRDDLVAVCILSLIHI